MIALEAVSTGTGRQAVLFQARAQTALEVSRQDAAAASEALRTDRSALLQATANAAEAQRELASIARDRDAALESAKELRGELDAQQKAAAALQSKVERARAAAALAARRSGSAAPAGGSEADESDTPRGVQLLRPRRSRARPQRQASGSTAAEAGAAAAGMAALLKQMQHGAKRLEELTAVRCTWPRSSVPRK